MTPPPARDCVRLPLARRRPMAYAPPMSSRRLVTATYAELNVGDVIDHRGESATVTAHRRNLGVAYLGLRYTDGVTVDLGELEERTVTVLHRATR